MDVLIAVISGFALAICAPWLHRLFGNRVGLVIALLPAGLVAFFSRFIGTVGVEAVEVSYPWVPGLHLSLAFYLDGLSLFFALLITSIGVLISIYAGGYLSGHPKLGQFYVYLLVFLGAMLGTVLAGNLLTLYVFWELTTLSSYLLVGFEHKRASARAAAQQALLVTALGGLAMLAGLILLGTAGGTYSMGELLERGDLVRDHAYYPAILVLVLLGAFTKSAQFPFHFWLPNAMEAPTPVSAYLHSATMVKAGVYLLARLLPVLGGTDAWMVSVTTFGAITMVLGAVLAYRAHDLKAILAYLTVNVLGTLVMLLGLGTEHAVEAAMTYLMAHACYKAALFLMAGTVDHAAHTRDIRELGGLVTKMPVTATAAVLAALSMAGMLPFFGFISKELFLEAVWHAPVAATWVSAAAVGAAIFLVAGACLISLRPFFGSLTEKSGHAHEGGVQLWFGPILLASAGLGIGLFPQDAAVPFIGPAVSAVLHEPVTMKLALWHGVTPIFLVSMSVLVAGVVLYFLRPLVLPFGDVFSGLERFGPLATYGRCLAGLNWTARSMARSMQSGYLRWYVVTLLAVTVVLTGIALAAVGRETLNGETGDVRFHEGIAVALIMLAALAAVVTTSRLAAIASLGVVGFGVAWLFLLYGAPDLAMTQIVTEALTVVLFVLAFLRLPKFTLKSPPRNRLRDALLALAAGGLVTVLLLLVTTGPQIPSISDYFAESSVPLAHGRNVVNVILVDFRALDTLGEITVLATAAVGVYALLRISLKRT
jgi:multicomponent Na+:H+ antiporter subunit A